MPLPSPLLRCALLLALSGPAVAADGPAQVTLTSGTFNGTVSLAVDSDRRLLSGYFDDGRCRFQFDGPLQPVALPQRSELGEAYSLRGWDPRTPERSFSVALYTLARGGFRDQLTIEADDRDPNRPAACRWRTSLDRDSWVSSSFIGVRVVSARHAKVSAGKPDGDGVRLERSTEAAVPRGTVVWVGKTYSPGWNLPGLVQANWYQPVGTPHGGYLREADLYRLPAQEEELP